MDPTPTRYQIRIHGHLGPTALSAFPPPWPPSATAPTPSSPALLDQSALDGVLAEIEALSPDLLDLLEVR